MIWSSDRKWITLYSILITLLLLSWACIPA
jgi:hypothetical protein